MKVLKAHKCFGGQVEFWEHASAETRTTMRFSTFRPEGRAKGALVWLSGLTCNEENFITKAGAQRALAAHGLAVICPDTSPRGLDLPGEHEAWDFGSGAGFYVDAVTPGYRDHYRMESYVSKEVHALARELFEVGDRVSIFGHSMGGHGALVLGLREPAKWQAVSAFSPIVNPSACPWGEKAFTGYLGDDRARWREHDATELVKSGRKHPRPLLVDQGTADSFLEKELLTHRLAEACKASGQPAEVRMREGYDHSYYFIATFVEDHVRWHAEQLS